MRFSVLMVVLALFAAAGPASAQPAPDPAALGEAKRLMDQVGVEALMHQQLAAMPAQMRSIFASIDIDKDKDKDELIARYADVAAKELERRVPKYIEQVTALYARTFTFDELRELNAFYDSTLGKKLIATLPALTRESSALSQQMTGDAIRETFRVLAPELEKYGVKPK